jgi:transposase
MSHRRIATMDILEVLRLLRAGESDRAVRDRLGLNRRTVAKYRSWASEQGFMDGALPTPAEVRRRLEATQPVALPPQQTSSVAGYAEEIAAYRARGMEVAAIRGRLEEVHGEPISYSAVWRLVHRQEPATPEAVVRVEVAPGSQAQVDFGYAGYTIDPASGKARKTWVFVMVLSWSRHCYAELVFDQRVETWLLCHRHAFESFGAVPKGIVLDNLKAAILHASVHDPVVQRSYRECALHYDFLIDPNPPRMPYLKGKVGQGGVHYVKRNFLAGRDATERFDDLNRKLRLWITETAGQRLHGTTKAKPLERFRETEQTAMSPLPAVPYDPASWAQLSVYRDCHVTFERAYYSAPFRLIGQQVWVRGGARTVEIFTDGHEVVATHSRVGPGERQTNLLHLPPEKVPGLVITRETCQQQAQDIGLQTAALVERLLAHRPEDRLRSAGRILALAKEAGEERLERACARALAFGNEDYPTVKRILAEGLDAEPPLVAFPANSTPSYSDTASPPPAFAFVRSGSEFASSLQEATR